MSIHFLLGLPNDIEKEQLKKVYRKKLLSLHPDRSKNNTIVEYLKLKKAYDMFKTNGFCSENLYLNCKIEDVNNMKCRCGTFFNSSNILNNKIECETCSCYVLIEI